MSMIKQLVLSAYLRGLLPARFVKLCFAVLPLREA